jgi:hypothetical protein
VNAIAALAHATDGGKTKGAVMILRLLALLSLVTALSAGDGGILIDPNGGTANADYGCGIDPNGGCAFSNFDKGLGVDPNG